jgi:hypothetical protein
MTGNAAVPPPDPGNPEDRLMTTTSHRPPDTGHVGDRLMAATSHRRPTPESREIV